MNNIIKVESEAPPRIAEILQLNRMLDILPSHQRGLLLCELAMLGAKLGLPIHVVLVGPTGHGKDGILTEVKALFSVERTPMKKSIRWWIHIDDASLGFWNHSSDLKDARITLVFGEHASDRVRMRLRVLRSQNYYQYGLYSLHKRTTDILGMGGSISTLESMSEQQEKSRSDDDRNRTVTVRCQLDHGGSRAFLRLEAERLQAGGSLNHRVEPARARLRDTFTRFVIDGAKRVRFEVPVDLIAEDTLRGSYAGETRQASFLLRVAVLLAYIECPDSEAPVVTEEIYGFARDLLMPCLGEYLRPLSSAAMGLVCDLIRLLGCPEQFKDFLGFQRVLDPEFEIGIVREKWDRLYGHITDEHGNDLTLVKREAVSCALGKTKNQLQPHFAQLKEMGLTAEAKTHSGRSAGLFHLTQRAVDIFENPEDYVDSYGWKDPLFRRYADFVAAENAKKNANCNSTAGRAPHQWL